MFQSETNPMQHQTCLYDDEIDKAVKQMIANVISAISEQIVNNQATNQIVTFVQYKPTQKTHYKPQINSIKSLSNITLPTGSHFISQKQIQSTIYTPKKKNQKKSGDLNDRPKIFLQCLGHKIPFKGDFIQAKYYLLRTSNQHNFSVSRDLEKILTIKKNNSQVIKSIFSICLPILSQRPVYQLQNYSKHPSNIGKIKLVRVSGTQQQFQAFSRKLIFSYWRNNLVQLNSMEIAEIFCLMQTNLFLYEQQKCQRAFSALPVKKTESQERIEEWREDFMKNIKSAQNKVLNKLSEYGQKINIEELQNCVQKIIFDYFCGPSFYKQIIGQKLKSYQRKRSQILAKTAITQAYKYLDLQYVKGQFSQQFITDMDISQFPYESSVQILNNLSHTNDFYQNMKFIREFCCEMARTYHTQKQLITQNVYNAQIFDMDSQLPVTILCVLMCQNQNLNIITTYLIDYSQMQDNFGTQNRILTALNAAYDFINNQWSLND